MEKRKIIICINEQTVFIVKWTKPEVVNGKVVGKITTNQLLFTDIGKYMDVIYQLKTKWSLIEADWHVEVTTLDNKKIYEQSFNTVKMEE